ncbi:hypothetical protein MKW92_052286 [Papaver armeniacum]|nr:hypothetical protein MKW92_052286 [Papaver armeniacum]
MAFHVHTEYQATDLFFVFKNQGTMKIQEQGTVYTPFINLEPDKTANEVVKALILKVWKFENKRSGKVWSLELHLMDQNGNQIHARVGKDHVQLIQRKIE